MKKQRGLKKFVFLKNFFCFFFDFLAADGFFYFFLFSFVVFNRKRAKKVRKFHELHIYRINHELVPIILETGDQRHAMMECINMIINACKQYQQEIQNYQVEPEKLTPDEIQEKAEMFTTYGSGFFDAVVGECSQNDLFWSLPSKYLYTCQILHIFNFLFMDTLFFLLHFFF